MQPFLKNADICYLLFICSPERPKTQEILKIYLHLTILIQFLIKPYKVIPTLIKIETGKVFDILTSLSENRL